MKLAVVCIAIALLVLAWIFSVLADTVRRIDTLIGQAFKEIDELNERLRKEASNETQDD